MKNSTIGTNNTNAFSPLGLCRIIETCHKNGVSKLQFGDFSVEFHNADGPKENCDQPKTPMSETDLVSPLATPAEEKEGQRTLDVTTRDLLREFHDEQLMLDDPLAFEQQQTDYALGRQGNNIDETESNRRP